jgi:uncharacterized membrane protein YkvA (DUF1232 family)
MKYIGLAKALFSYYQKIPKQYRWLVWLIPVFYWIMPIDLFPDVVLGLGKIDDIIVVLICFWLFDKLKDMANIWEKDLGQGSKQQKQRKSNAGVPATEDPYAVLGVEKDADPETCKQAYRNLIKQYHPDRYNHLGPEFEAVAREKTEAVITAYEQISK